MPYIHILEQQTWLTAGLRRAFPEWQSHILYRDTADGLSALDQFPGPGLQLLDFEALPREAARAISRNASPEGPVQVAIIGREQRPLRWEILQTGCPCLLQKPFPIVQIAEVCRQLLENLTAAPFK